MKFTLDDSEGFRISGYEAGVVIVNQEAIPGSLVVTPNRLLRHWGPMHFDQLSVRFFDELAALVPEVLLVGTGARLRFPAPSLYRPLVERGIGVEFMDTAAACRTYNILMAEGRRVAAALLPIEAPSPAAPT